MMMLFGELAQLAYQTASEKGHLFDWSIYRDLAQIHSEVSEALAEYEAGRRKMEWDGDKPVGLPVELADIVMRVFTLSVHVGVDLEEIILVKDQYNRTRPVRNGKKVELCPE